ncbi:MAG: hypothetical protein ACE14P_11230 [Methanotrichaceae archaeon]
MKVTTSRDPSAKARRLGKIIARFLSIPYVNRGKLSLSSEDEEPWLVVVEDHGNPTGIVKRTAMGEELLAFTLSSDPKPGQFKRLAPSVAGTREDAKPIARFFGLELSAEPTRRSINVCRGQIDFINEGEIILRLKDIGLHQ